MHNVNVLFLGFLGVIAILVCIFYILVSVISFFAYPKDKKKHRKILGQSLMVLILLLILMFGPVLMS